MRLCAPAIPTTGFALIKTRSPILHTLRYLSLSLSPIVRLDVNLLRIEQPSGKNASPSREILRAWPTVLQAAADLVSGVFAEAALVVTNRNGTFPVLDQFTRRKKASRAGARVRRFARGRICVHGAASNHRRASLLRSVLAITITTGMGARFGSVSAVCAGRACCMRAGRVVQCTSTTGTWPPFAPCARWTCSLEPGPGPAPPGSWPGCACCTVRVCAARACPPLRCACCAHTCT
jgi:hypothetical protein